MNKIESPWLQRAHRVPGWAASGCYVARATRVLQTWFRTPSPWSKGCFHQALKSLSQHPVWNSLCSESPPDSWSWEEQFPPSVTRQRSQLETQEKQQVLPADGWQRNEQNSEANSKLRWWEGQVPLQGRWQQRPLMGWPLSWDLNNEEEQATWRHPVKVTAWAYFELENVPQT